MVFELMSPEGVLLRRDAVGKGYDDNYLARLVRSGRLKRIRQGSFAEGPTWAGLGPRDRIELAGHAVVRQYGEDIALSHDSAVLRHQGPDHGLDLSRVHVTHLDQKGSRIGAGVVHHEGRCGVLDVTRQPDCWVTSPARTVADIAMTRGLEVGVVVADDFLRRGLTSTEELRAFAETVKFWPGALHLRLVIDLATGKSESVAESLSWLLFRNQQLPRPEQQYEVSHPDGRIAGRTDWAWPEFKVLGEFDGVGKYVRYLRPGESVADAVIREKRREDLLRELTGWIFIRLMWADLLTPERTAHRIRRALGSAAA